MKALYTEAPGDYRLVDRPVPLPGADEALVKVAAAAICHTDVIIRAGVADHVRYPVIPGHEFAGLVEACSPAVRYLSPGDRVAVETIISCGQCTACRMGDTAGCEHYDELGSKSDGGFSEYCAVPARHLIKLPGHVPLVEAALLEPLANAVSAVRQSNIKLNERVLIIGPGPIGLLALQVARLASPSMLVLAGTREERLMLGRTLGATHTVNVKRERATDVLQDLFGGKGADVVIECAGTRSALELAIESIGWRGRIAIEGDLGSELVPVSPRFLQNRSASLISICGWVAADFARALQLLSYGLVDVKALITHTFTLEEWEAAFDMVTTHKSEALKVMFML